MCVNIANVNICLIFILVHQCVDVSQSTVSITYSFFLDNKKVSVGYILFAETDFVMSAINAEP